MALIIRTMTKPTAIRFTTRLLFSAAEESEDDELFDEVESLLVVV